MNIGLFGAFVGGILTLLSPCSVMLLPAFFSYAFADSRTLLTRTGMFYLGLITALVPLGMLAGTLGAFVNTHRSAFVTGASVVVIILGVLMLAGVQFPRVTSRGLDGTAAVSVYALGTVYGLAGVCAGPLLGAVLTFAALSGNALMGGLTLLVFAAGMTLPLLLLALLWGRLPVVRRLVRPREVRLGRWRSTWTAVIGGLLTIGVGAFLLLTQGTATLGGLIGATDMSRIEGAVLRSSSPTMELWIALGVVVLASAAIALVRRRRRTSGYTRNRPSEGTRS
ncbi:cytochrome c biogenesis CcdA family protein [Leucobacter allii]|uniref:cytochrome c biogenesis CcdA family protein n=1 Tax=Leucobacter allii TaxID=2932247 RepID=UPI001FD4B138|nr:cytochrome c biogenesis CcdA family protein [Leucobacter allii]UOR01505.1 cytochrome c biogenesis CcdA family protein [Leucobacter allii]